MLPLTLSALLAFQEPQQAAPIQTPAATAPNFQTAPTVAEPMRLALTPNLDGAIEAEEWDPFASAETTKSYFQWEPGRLHIGGTVSEGSDLLASVDLKGNGWLVGGDNLEIRIGMRDGTPRVMGRLLDATHVEGPRWIDLPGVGAASLVAAKSEGGVTTFEATVSDGGLELLPTGGKKIAVRIDAVPATEALAEPFVPRVLSPVTLTMTRAAALPSSLRWGVEGDGGSVVPGDGIRIRFTFNGEDKLGLQRFSMRSEGLARAATGDSAVPFPPFDNKNRAFVDYSTPVSRDASLGYRIAQGSLSGADGVTGVVQASYRIAPELELSMARVRIKSRADAQKIRLNYDVKSNSTARKRTDGNVRIVPPPGFSVASGDDRDFSVYSPKGSVRRVFELQIPAAAKGVYPIGFRMEVGGKVTEATGYLNID